MKLIFSFCPVVLLIKKKQKQSAATIVLKNQ